MNEKRDKYDGMVETHQINDAVEKKRKRRRIRYIILTLLVTGAFFALCYHYLFKVVTVEYSGNSYYSTEELSQAFGIGTGDKLLSFSKTEREEYLLEKFPYLAECKIDRIIPDKITVTVSERQAIMYTYVSGKYVIFDKEMYVVELSDTKPDLIEVRFDESILIKCVLGDPVVFKDERTGVGLYRLYEALISSPVYMKTEYITVKSRFDYYLNYEDTFEVYLGDSLECPAKLLFLWGIIEKLPQGSSGRIDVSNPTEGYFKEK